MLQARGQPSWNPQILAALIVGLVGLHRNREFRKLCKFTWRRPRPSKLHSQSSHSHSREVNAYLHPVSVVKHYRYLKS